MFLVCGAALVSLVHAGGLAAGSRAEKPSEEVSSLLQTCSSAPIEQVALTHQVRMK